MESTDPVREAGASDRTPHLSVRVADKTPVSTDTVVLELVRVDAGPMPSWRPGAHVDVVLPNGRTPQYSLCGSPDDDTSWRVAVLRESNGSGGSAYVHDILQVGDELAVGQPRNNFALVPFKRYLFVAGGIGITPMIPMAQEAQRVGADWDLVYCARNRAAMPFLDELISRYGDKVRPHADDHSGIFDLVGHFAEVPEGAAVYACGPRPFLDATTEATRHWPRGTVHFERFVPSEERLAPTEGFDAELALSGRVVHVPCGRSLLEVLRESGVPVLSSCAEGTCGTCEVNVLAGRVDHRDAVLNDEERESHEMMMVCVSRAARGERLVLDL